MTTILAVITLAMLAAAVPVVRAVRRQYERDVVLSPATVVAVWVLYAIDVGIVVAAVAGSAWSMSLPQAVRVALGSALLAIGLGLVVAGLVSMASFRRMSGMQPDRLVTNGAFRYSRNPQNVGVGLAMIGAAVLGDSGLALIAALGFWTAFVSYVGYEEAHLTRVFGREYETYRVRTPRFLGIPGDRDLVAADR